MGLRVAGESADLPEDDDVQAWRGAHGLTEGEPLVALAMPLAMRSLEQNRSEGNRIGWGPDSTCSDAAVSLLCTCRAGEGRVRVRQVIRYKLISAW
jgi:hypothetical protein